LRLLNGHPAMTAVALGASHQVGAAISSVHPHALGMSEIVFSSPEETAATPADVCFSCMPSGALGPLLDTIDADLIIDLSDEYRADPDWTYGLTEHARDRLPGATRIANPGCFPTATLLGLIPFAAAGAIGGPVIVDAMSGVSGAGKGLGDPMSFSALHASVTAYGATTHRHVPEMERGLAAFQELTVSFTPHLVPMARGLLVTARAPLAIDLDDHAAIEILSNAYEAEPFISVIEGWPATKSVLGTNRALVSARVDNRARLLIVSVAIDNLGKGAAGQALQNANVVLGLEETSGLGAVGVWP
jgi:N-acetyl-gamma-glutamyl-phosphate reductase